MTVKTRDGNGRARRSLETAARDMRAAELYGKGWSYQRIAGELGFASKGHAHNAIQRAFAAIPTEDAAQAKRVDLERIERLIEINWEVLERQHVAISNGRVVRRFIGIERDEDGIERLDPDGKTIPVFEDVMDDGPISVTTNTIARLLERRAKMHAYDEPVHTRVEFIGPDMVEASIARLESELAVNDPGHTGTA